MACATQGNDGVQPTVWSSDPRVIILELLQHPQTISFECLVCMGTFLPVFRSCTIKFPLRSAMTTYFLKLDWAYSLSYLTTRVVSSTQLFLHQSTMIESQHLDTRFQLTMIGVAQSHPICKRFLCGQQLLRAICRQDSTLNKSIHWYSSCTIVKCW